MSFNDLVGETQGFVPLEDLIVEYLRPLKEYIPGLEVQSWIPRNMSTPFILVRRDGHGFASDNFAPNADPRFTRRGAASIETFTADPNGDENGAVLHDVIYRRLFTALRRQETIPSKGHLSGLITLQPAKRASDWATSTGVVQYANLPKNLHRYEAVYGIGQRPDLGNPPDQLALLLN